MKKFGKENVGKKGINEQRTLGRSLAKGEGIYASSGSSELDS
jgi:hypothetical protein